MSNALSGQWSGSGNATTVNSSYTSEDTNNQRHVWYNFRLAQEIVDDPTTVIRGIEVQLRSTALTGSGTPNNDCRVTAEVTWNRSDALAWSAPLRSDPIPTSNVDRIIGSSSNIAAWGGTPGPATTCSTPTSRSG